MFFLIHLYRISLSSHKPPQRATNLWLLSQRHINRTSSTLLSLILGDPHPLATAYL